MKIDLIRFTATHQDCGFDYAGMEAKVLADLNAWSETEPDNELLSITVERDKNWSTRISAWVQATIIYRKKGR